MWFLRLPIVFGILSLCLGEGYWDIELSPQSITTVPFGPGHISVWEHATTKGRYYAMPLVRLLQDSAETIENILTGETELNFKILMWSLEAREAVFRHLKSNTNQAIKESQVELLPMEKIRIVWKDHVRPLASYFSLANEWRSNTDLPSEVRFQFVCSDAGKCTSLQKAMKTRPEMFDALELEYIINGQKSARRQMTVTGQHLTQGDLYSKLKNMPVNDGVRYLSSDDVKTLTSQTVSNVISTVRTDSDYVDTGDEVSLSDAVKRVLEREKTSVENFHPKMWESVFWDPSFARPDKVVHYLSKVFRKDTSDSKKLFYDESQRSKSSEGGLDGSLLGGIFSGSASGKTGSDSHTKVQKEDVLNTLKDRYKYVEWDGEKFVVKPMKMSRLNLSTLSVSTNIASTSIQVRRYESVQSIKVRTGGEKQTPSLTPQLVKAQLEALMNQKMAAQDKARADMRKTLGQSIGKVDARANEAKNQIQAVASGLNEKFVDISKMFDYFPGYCRGAGQICGDPYRKFSLAGKTPDKCKAACDSEPQCISFSHNNAFGGECFLYNFRCSWASLQKGSGKEDLFENRSFEYTHYYIKISRVPAITTEMWKAIFSGNKLNTSLDPCKMLDKDYQRV